MIKKYFKNALDNLSSIDLKNILKKIQKYEYVSFDIFDTLVKRDVPKPEYVFNLVENELIKSGIEYRDFAISRKTAECRARELSGKEEITLTDIYEQLHFKSDEIRQCVMNIELNTELKVCVANRKLMDIYQYCIEHKKVIIISDMYLPRTIIEQILKNCGITSYYRLYISEEYNMTKGSGSLYEYVLQDLNLKKLKILHIGNAFKTDYIQSMRHGYSAIKIATQSTALLRNYKESNDDVRILNTFIDNHEENGLNYYEQVGYEQFGPLLYGFTIWLYKNIVYENIKNVIFLARDGYVMKKVYEQLGFDKKVPASYLEVSRRSLRTPKFDVNMSINELTDVLTLSKITNMIQIFDGIGLDIDEYESLLLEYGYEKSEPLQRDLLRKSLKFSRFYERLKPDIIKNKNREMADLEGYLKKFDFSGKTAIVDIGWGGTMQRYLEQTLDDMGMEHHIKGYYFGLTSRAIENLKKNGMKAKGYLFDSINKGDADMERSFVGLFETFFLEQDGSVKNYCNDNGDFKPVRYQYEYINNGELSKEAVNVESIQAFALKFVKDFRNSYVRRFIHLSSGNMFHNLKMTCIKPSVKDTDAFGDFEFFNNGEKKRLAAPQKFILYIRNPELFFTDFLESRWKVGFLKRCFKVKINYYFIYNIMRKFEK